MSLLALMLGWLLARTIRIVPAGRESQPVPGTPSVPTTPVPPQGGGSRRRPRTSRRPTTPSATTRPATTAPTASTSAPPWPQLMPTGLPPFPSGWVPFEPPSPAVVARANALLPQLWRGGPGTFKVEQTAGVWVYYRATPMGEKKGVVAFRERSPGSATADTAREARAIDEAVTMPALVVRPAGPTSPASSSSTALPTLRRGSKGSDVRILQQRLGITADGDFGPKTEAAVRAYQARNGLVADGIVGPKTWASLMAKAA